MKTKTKVILIVFFGMVHHEFVLPGQNVTGAVYVQVLQILYDALRRKLSDDFIMITHIELHIVYCAEMALKLLK